MAMIMYCWHAIKLESVHSAIVQSCVGQVRHNITTRLQINRNRNNEAVQCSQHTYLFVAYLTTLTIICSRSIQSQMIWSLAINELEGRSSYYRILTMVYNFREY
jgi:hypothetical protein